MAGGDSGPRLHGAVLFARVLRGELTADQAEGLLAGRALEAVLAVKASTRAPAAELYVRSALYPCRKGAYGVCLTHGQLMIDCKETEGSE